MNALPVILRELRAEARNPFTHSLRLVGGVILVGLLAFFWLTTEFAPDAGGRLFMRLHQALFLAIWILVPLVAADCLSRERRERTLGLLFLTPLRPLDIVVAKSLVHGLRALSLWFSALPVLAVPLLLGGVSWGVALASVLVNGSAIGWALAAGLIASALGKSRSQALAMASCLGAGGFFGFGYLSGLSGLASVAAGWGNTRMETLASGLWLDLQLGQYWSYPGLMFSGGGRGLSPAVLLWIMGRVAAFSLVALLLALPAAAGILRRVWQEKPESRAWLWFYRVFCTPFIWRTFFDRWIRRKLEQNPIGWLEQRQWSGRTAIGAWLAVILSLYIVMLQDSSLYHRVNTQVQTSMAWLLAVSLAVASAGSFRRERELGVMELLLVTPLGPRRIALGRLRGIWEQFFPAIAMLLGIWSYIAATFGHSSDWALIVFSASMFLAVPVVGLHFSLTQRSLIGALARTFLLTLALPALIPASIGYLRDVALVSPDLPAAVPWLTAAAGEVAVAALYWRRLQLVLEKRTFPMEVR